MDQRRNFSDDDFMPHYRQRFSITGRPYEFYRAGYRYGWDLAHSEQYDGRPFVLLEGQARRNWDRNFPHRSWDEVRDAVSEGWRHARSG